MFKTWKSMKKRLAALEEQTAQLNERQQRLEQSCLQNPSAAFYEQWNALLSYGTKKEEPHGTE